MHFELSEEHRVLRQEIRRFASETLNEGMIQRDREEVFSPDLWRACAGMGLMGLPVPEEYGGSGLDALSTAIALEALGYGCEDSGLVFSICAHLLPCVVPIWQFGTEEQKRRYLPGLCDGSLIAANGMTEAESGSDAFAMRTRAERDGEGFRITGSKIFASNGPVSDLALIFAMTDRERGFHGGVTAFLVEQGSNGYRATQRFEKMGLRTSPIGELVFEEVYVPESAVVGGVGGGAALFARGMDWERTCLFASHVGTMERLLERAVEHARNRKQSGTTLAKFQAISHKIADMKVDLEGARLLSYRAAWNLEHSKSAAMDASISKLFVSEALVRTARNALQILGGYGFLTEYEVERAMRDALGSTLYSGTSEVQRNIIARWLGL